MVRPKPHLITLLLLSSLLLAAVAWGQETSPSRTIVLQLKTIKVPSQISELHHIFAFKPMTKSSGIALGTSVVYEGPINIHTFKLTKNGKMTLLDSIEEDLESPPGMSVVWIEGVTDGNAPAVGGHGLLFYGHEQDNYEWGKVSYAKIDSKGKFTEGPTQIIYFPRPTEGDEVYVYPARATKGPNSVGVAVSIEVYNDAADNSTAYGYFFETDFDGNMIGGIREMPFDPNVNQYARVYAPIWSGTRWLVPARVVEYTTGVKMTCQMVSMDSVVAAAPISATDSDIQVIYQVVDLSTKYIDSLEFLPNYQGTSAIPLEPTATQRYNLMIHLTGRIPDHTAALTQSSNECLIQQIKDTGVKFRLPKKVTIKPWERAQTAVANTNLTEYEETFSRFIAYDNDVYMVARVCKIARESEVSSPPKITITEGHIGLLYISNKYKKIEEVASADLPGEQYPDYWPVLSTKDNKTWLIQEVRDPNAAKTLFYVTTLTH
jgi:hypothetical protein